MACGHLFLGHGEILFLRYYQLMLDDSLPIQNHDLRLHFKMQTTLFHDLNKL